jgi:hypothetical protein
MSLINLTEEHVAAVERVLKTGYPVAGADSVHAQFGYVTILQDSEVRHLTLRKVQIEGMDITGKQHV